MKFIMLHICGTVLLIAILNQCDVFARPVPFSLDAVDYLSQFGYLNRNKRMGSVITDETFELAVKDFQRFAGIEQTGIIDEETQLMMKAPRCGVPDKFSSKSGREKRYEIEGSRWRSTQLSYKISKYTKQLRKPLIDEQIARAFKYWSDVSALEFEQKSSGDTTFDIGFEKHEHGDEIGFDGPGGVLAHANFPGSGDEVHFDDDEHWTVKSYRGTNLLQVATHEFGHSLGLLHSDVRGAVMAPFYPGYDPEFELHTDDIKGVQVIYGTKKPEGPKGGKKPDSPRPREPKKPKDVPKSFNLCTNSSIDAIFTSPGKKTFMFKGDYYWQLLEEHVADGYPQKISDDWDGLPSNIDAAFSYSNGKTYFFKDSRYWRYTGMSKDRGYPKKISTGFAGIPDNVDAAFVWSGNDKIYFFKGNQYWKYDPTRNPPMDHFEYPYHISTWENVPDNIDAAFQWHNSYTYFFKGSSYWRFNDRKFKVDAGLPPFPRPTAEWWFGCSAKESKHEDDEHEEEKEEEPKEDIFFDGKDDPIRIIIFKLFYGQRG